MAANPQPIRPVRFEPDAAPAKGAQMSEQSAIDSAVKRLAMALDALDAAVERRREGDRNENSLAAQVQTLGLDRARLASVLDSETARTRQLEATNREIADRLDTAIASIQSVLESGE
jgi:Domain of unknown function (DUF4164)